ncbi:MAG: hypothetical protein AB7V50_01235 [Vampirovibrionia bacterium]
MMLKKQHPGGKEYSTLYNELGLASGQKIVALWGYPDPVVLNNIRAKYPEHLLVDLDIPYGVLESKLLPDNYCQIITNIVDNALALHDKIDLIVASVGEEKCDQGRFAAYILEQKGFNVVKTRFVEYDFPSDPLIISVSDLPLKKKVLTIMDTVIDPDLKSTLSLNKIKPTHGFWGVPPNDLDILDLFPASTHVYGWTRCVEARHPADLNLEMFVDESVPTVFFAQTFCAKMQLAKYLAKKYDGLYVDVDDSMNVSVRAKIEAFLRLS